MSQIEPKTIVDMFETTALKYPDHTAIGLPERNVTFRELKVMVDETAAGLQAIGVKPGHPIGLSLPNSLHAVVAYLGILKAGGVAVNFNPKTPTAELEPKVRNSGIVIMMMANHRDLNKQIAPLLSKTSLAHIIVCPMGASLSVKDRLGYRLKYAFKPDAADRRYTTFAQLVSGQGIPTPVTLCASDISDIVYTSGTSGLPKGVMRTHGNALADIKQANAWLTRLTPGEERVLGYVPAFHVYGKVSLLLSLSIAAAYCPMMKPNFELFATLEKNKITVLPVVPYTYKRLNALPDAKRDSACKHLKYCIAGGEPLTPTVVEEFLAKTGIRILNGYGSTEGGPMMGGTPDNATAVEIVAAKGTRFTIIGEDGHQVKPGETGQILFSGESVMAGYHNNPAATAEKMPDPYSIWTGDTGHQNPDGSISLTGRMTDMVIVNGNNVYPVEVENAISRHGAVAECAVFGVPGRNGGEQVKAMIVLRDDETVSNMQMIGFLKENLLPYKIPTLIEFRKEPLPRNPIGKVDKRALQDNPAVLSDVGARPRQWFGFGQRAP